MDEKTTESEVTAPGLPEAFASVFPVTIEYKLEGYTFARTYYGGVALKAFSKSIEDDPPGYATLIVDDYYKLEWDDPRLEVSNGALVGPQYLLDVGRDDPGWELSAGLQTIFETKAIDPPIRGEAVDGRSYEYYGPCSYAGPDSPDGYEIEGYTPITGWYCGTATPVQDRTSMEEGDVDEFLSLAPALFDPLRMSLIIGDYPASGALGSCQVLVRQDGSMEWLPGSLINSEEQPGSECIRFYSGEIPALDAE